VVVGLVWSRAGPLWHGGSAGIAACGRKDAVMAERGQRPILLDAGMDQTVPGDALRVSAHIVEGALRRMRGPFRKRSESSKVLSSTPLASCMQVPKPCRKRRTKTQKHFGVRRTASAVAIVIPEFPAAPYAINVLAREIRRTIVKKLRKRFKIRCAATDRLKKCDTFASMIRKKLPRAKSSHASFLKNATDHPRAPRVRDLDLR